MRALQCSSILDIESALVITTPDKQADSAGRFVRQGVIQKRVSTQSGGIVNTYVPKPIVTTEVELPPELHDLIERLAENNHDQWAKQRIAEGWTYGPERSDALKTNPDLVPYGDLSEGEKEYDRISVVETLNAIIALGYEINRGDQ